jgi:predicted DNA-binding WGR domain protein
MSINKSKYPIYLENTTGNHNKFYLIELRTYSSLTDTKSVVVTYGRIGTKGKEKVHITNVSDSAAGALADNLLTSKLAKGYQIVKKAHGLQLPLKKTVMPSIDNESLKKESLARFANLLK